MAAPVQRDLQTTREILTHWFAARLPEADSVEIEGINTPSGGASSDTLVVDARVLRGKHRKPQRWIVRIQANRIQIYQDPGVEKQFRILEVLGRYTDVPVPKTRWYEADAAVLGAPFFVMDAVEGQVPMNYNAPGWLADASQAQRAQLWESAIQSLALVHRTDVSLLAFLNRSELGQTGLDQEIATWNRYLDWVRPAPHPALDRACRWLPDHAPKQKTTGLAWGDAQLSNMIFKDYRCVAVIDWETVSLGGAEEDLAWWLTFDDFYADMSGLQRLPGLGDRAATIAAWEHYAGRKVQALEWHDVFAAFRLAVITEKAMSVYAAAGHALEGMSPGDGNPAMRRLARLLALGS